MTVQNTIKMFLLLLLVMEGAQAKKGIVVGGIVLAEAIIARADAAVGPNAQTGETFKLMSSYLAEALKRIGVNLSGAKDGLVWGEIENKTIELDTTNEFGDSMAGWLILLNRRNPTAGILSGNQITGFGPGLDEKLEMHIFNGYGVADTHLEVHSSLAILYKTTTHDDKFVMMKIDLQAGSGDMAQGGNDIISILHEIKIVDGINRENWDMGEITIKMSLTQLFKIVKKTIDNTYKKYDEDKNNCIQFKNNLLKNMEACEKSIIDSKVPEKNKPKDTELLGDKALFCWTQDAQDGLIWGETNGKTIELENAKFYGDSMEGWLVYLNNANPEAGLVSGSPSSGYGPGLDAKLEMHIFNGYGVADNHLQVHSSLAILYKTTTHDYKFVMMKIDLQAGSGDMARGGNDRIFILHEIKIVNGINRGNWDMGERKKMMSLAQLFKIVKKTIDKTNKKYDNYTNNSIQFKNNILKNMEACDESIIDSKVPEKRKPKDTGLLGYKSLVCLI